ncbi:MAG: S-layer homology domain-containing protein [Bacillota bacterium]
MTRGLLIIMLITSILLLSVPVLVAASQLKDLAGTKYERPVIALFQIGVVKGTPAGRFEPLRTITRAEFAAMVVRAIGAEANARAVGNQTPVFPDVNETWKWAWGYINVATSRGIIKGYPDGRFGPGDDVKYEEAVTMVVRALGHENEALSGGNWPSGHIAVAKGLGLIQGTDFTVGLPATRGDLAIMTKAAVYDVKDGQGRTLAQTVHASLVVSRVTVTADKQSTVVGDKVVCRAVAYDVLGNTLGFAPAWSVDNPDGVVNARGEFVGTLGGRYRVIASVGQASGSVVITVAGRASEIALEASRPQVNANGRATSVITARLVDPRGYIDTSYTGTVNFTISGPGTLPAVSRVDVVRGEASVVVTAGDTPGNIRVTATSQGVAGRYIDVKAVRPVASQILTSVDFAQLGADGVSRAVITATIADSEGSRVVTSNHVVTFHVVGTEAFSVVTMDADPTRPGVQVTPFSGQARLVLQSKTNPGRATVEASVDGLLSDAGVTVLSVTTGPPHALVFEGRPSDVSVDDPEGMAVSVKLVDSQGNLCTAQSGWPVTLGITERGSRVVGSAVAIPSTVPLQQGRATFQVVNTEAEEVELSATAGNFMATDKVRAKFLAGAAAGVKITEITPSVLAADGSALATITARVFDQFGNFVPTATNEISFIKAADAGAVTLHGPAQTKATNGIARLTVRATTVPSVPDGDLFDAIGRKTDGTMLVNLPEEPEANRVVTAVFGAPDHLVVNVASVTAGNPQQITVSVKDYARLTITSLNEAPINLALVSGEGALVPSFGRTQRGTATFTFTSTRAQDGVRVKASYGLLTVTSAPFSVLPAQAESVALRADHQAVAADGISVISISAEERDRYGNRTGPNQSHILLASLPEESGVLSQETIAPGGSVQYTAGTKPATVSLKALDGVDSAGLPVSGITINTYLAGAPHRLEIMTPIPHVVADGTSTQTVAVRAVDYNGNWVSGLSAGPGSITLVTSSGTARVVSGDGRIVNGMARFSITNTMAEEVTYTARASGLGLERAMTSGRFHAAIPDRVVLTASPTWIAADGISQSAILARVVDARGNVVNVDGTVTLVNSSPVHGRLDRSRISIVGGISTAPAILTATKTAGTCTISASSANIALATPTDHVPAIIAVGTDTVRYTVTPASSRVEAGQPLTVTITAIDSSGIAVAGANGVITLMESGNLGLRLGGLPIAGQTLALTNGQLRIVLVAGGPAGASGTITVSDGSRTGESGTIIISAAP